jgi:hypothetical protein
MTGNFRFFKVVYILLISNYLQQKKAMRHL